MALNGVREENGRWKGLTPSTIRQSRPAEKSRGEREKEKEEDDDDEEEEEGRIKVKPESIRFAPIVNQLKDQFLTETLENGPDAPFLFAACRASHNCDLRGTGQLRPGDNAAATRDGQSNNLDPADARS